MSIVSSPKSFSGYEDSLLSESSTPPDAWIMRSQRRTSGVNTTKDDCMEHIARRRINHTVEQ